eukprot:TRINITY_DN654843_c0_g1_i1.p1 TRINITY_DN654843_c0_g1~~TRINITY_DN654843_c0_g1_i1.p1  ORF type:complete len:151 (-),score=17.97 TRINITY_DN654843_c0_g1_i1:836-1288(-)
MKAHYVLRKKLGSGTFGTVFQAQSSQLRGKEVAVKRVRIQSLSKCEKGREVELNEVVNRSQVNNKAVQMIDQFFSTTTEKVKHKAETFVWNNMVFELFGTSMDKHIVGKRLTLNKVAIISLRLLKCIILYSEKLIINRCLCPSFYWNHAS